MPAYLTVAEFRGATVMPAELVDELEVAHPGWIGKQLERVSLRIDAKLRKRYPVPFASPFPEVVQDWLERIVTPKAWLRRGLDTNDREYDEIRAERDAAWEEIDEAANSEEGRFELPVAGGETGDTSAVTKGGPFGYSEQSPYVSTTRQAEVARREDADGRGTGG